MYTFEFNDTSKELLFNYLSKEFINQPDMFKEKIQNFIVYYNPIKKSEKFFDNNNNNNDDNNKLETLLCPSYGNFEFLFESNVLVFNFNEEGEAKMNTSFSITDSHLFYFKRMIVSCESLVTLTRFTDSVKNFEISEKSNHDVRIYYNFKNYWEFYTTIKPQSIDNIYLEPEIKDNLVQFIDNFIDEKDRYIRFGRLHKTNILLYGIPGSGKTCLCKAIAKKYKRDIYMFNFSKSLTDEVFIQLMKEIPKQSIILLEDIDSFFEKRDSLNINISFSCLINILDGTMSSGNSSIMFITANNPQNIDSALLRPGRIDKIIKFDYPNKKIINLAFNELVDSELLNKFDEFYQHIQLLQLNMSSIIDYLFRNTKTFIKNINELIEQNDLRKDIDNKKSFNLYN